LKPADPRQRIDFLRDEFFYLFLSSEKGFAAFCCILIGTQKPIDVIDIVEDAGFLMVL
jgi:hypothetical protein